LAAWALRGSMKLAEPATDAATPEAATDFKNVRRFICFFSLLGFDFKPGSLCILSGLFFETGS
jgi:hypothetical protein